MTGATPLPASPLPVPFWKKPSFLLAFGYALGFTILFGSGLGEKLGLGENLGLSPANAWGWGAFTTLGIWASLEIFAQRLTLRQAQIQAQGAESFRQSILRSLPDALVVADEFGRIRQVNDAAIDIFGYERHEFMGEPIDSLLAEPYGRQFRERWKKFIDTGDAQMPAREVLANRKDGSIRPIELSFALLGNGDKGFMILAHDISTRKRVLARLEVAEQVLECTQEGVMVTDAKGTMLWVNAGFCRIFGYDRDEVIGKNSGFLKSGLQGPEFYAEMWTSIRDQGQWQGEIWNRRKDGQAFPEWLQIRPITDNAGQITRYVGVFSDITLHKQAEATIHDLKYSDPITKLANQHLFIDRLRRVIDRVNQIKSQAALVMIGLDRFRDINESFGYQVGDKVLVQTAERLAHVLRGQDIVARLRGDIFCCIVPDLHSTQDVHPIITRILECFDSPMLVDDEELFVTAKIGISLLPSDGQDPDELLAKAETAMIRSRNMVGGYQFYRSEMQYNSAERLRIGNEMRKGLARDEFYLVYQPKIATHTGELVGAEALLRWHNSDLGNVPPTLFIPVAEETGLILPLGAWVLDEVCRQIRDWKEMGRPMVKIAINISALQFRDPGFVDLVVECLKRHNVTADCLEIELTESAVMGDAETTITTLERLNELGVHLAVDDFGTGYSSLSYLKKFPIDRLKIDRSFVMDIDANPASAEIVGAIIAMGHTLNLKIVAEGVETDGQLAILRELKCNEIQGYYYARPLPAQLFEDFIDNRLPA